MGDEGVTIEARFDDGSAADVECAVVVPTFRRPEHLARTLDSLIAQRTDRRFAVVVVENDADGRAGLDTARRILGSGRARGLAVVARERGNCHAYNAGWSAALAQYGRARYLLAIDDDECADPAWLENLARTWEATGADIVGGPQVPVFDDERDRHWSRHPVFVPHYERSGPVPILYSSGNVLVRRAVFETLGAPFLDPVFNFTGGGDSDFHARARRRGFRFAWCQEAPVFETVPKRRTEFSWLQARSLRNGSLSTLIEHRADGSLAGRARTLAKSAALLLAAPARSVRLGFRTRSAVIGLYPLHVAVGRFLAEIGRVNEQYRRPEHN